MPKPNQCLKCGTDPDPAVHTGRDHRPTIVQDGVRLEWDHHLNEFNSGRQPFPPARRN